MNRILLVCAKENSAQTLEALLNDFLQAEIVRATQLQQAQELLSQHIFRLVIVNLPFHSENIEAFALGAAESTASGILLLCPQDSAQHLLERCLPQGILVLPKPFSSPCLSNLSIWGYLPAHGFQNSCRKIGNCTPSWKSSNWSAAPKRC